MRLVGVHELNERETMKIRHRKWLIVMFAAASLCLLGIAPESAYAATGNTAPTPGSATITEQATAAPAGVTTCEATADVEATGNWEAVITAGVFDGCEGDGPTPVDCHVQAVLQGESGLTSGYTDLLEAPSEPGCSAGVVSSGNVPCPTEPGDIPWTYRTEALFSVHFSDGSTSTGVAVSGTIGSDYQCDSLA